MFGWKNVRLVQAFIWKNRWTYAKPMIYDAPDPKTGEVREHQLECLRCDKCYWFCTEYQLDRNGFCQRCGYVRRVFWSAYPTRWQMLVLRFWDLLRNWRIYGKSGTGWSEPWTTVSRWEVEASERTPRSS